MSLIWNLENIPSISFVSLSFSLASPSQIQSQIYRGMPWKILTIKNLLKILSLLY